MVNVGKETARTPFTSTKILVEMNSRIYCCFYANTKSISTTIPTAQLWFESLVVKKRKDPQPQ